MKVISLVEKGWPRARRVAIRLTRTGGTIHHMIRGRMPADLAIAFISLDGTRVTGVSPRWYRMAVWLTLLQTLWRRHPAVVLVDNERAGRWVGHWFPSLRTNVLLLGETKEEISWLLWQQKAIGEVGRHLTAGAL